MCAVAAKTKGGSEPTPEDGEVGEAGDGRLPLASVDFFGENILALGDDAGCAEDEVGDDVAVGLGAVVCTTKWCKNRPVCSNCLSEGSWL